VKPDIVVIELGANDGLRGLPLNELGGNLGWMIGASKAAGARVIARVKCGVCHEIPGIPGAHGVVGPPLTGFARRSYIAGVLPNDPTRLVAWILDAPSLVPETLMPAQPLARREAQDAAAFLYTLL